MIKSYQLIKTLNTLDWIGAMLITVTIFVIIYNYKQDRHMKNKHKQPIAQRIKQIQNREKTLEDFDENE
jgi:uncharacterized membrane protein